MEKVTTAEKWIWVKQHGEYEAGHDGKAVWSCKGELYEMDMQNLDDWEFDKLMEMSRGF